MSALRTAQASMSSSLRVGAVGPAEVESSAETLGSNFAVNADMAFTWAGVLFLAAVVFLYIIL